MVYHPFVWVPRFDASSFPVARLLFPQLCNVKVWLHHLSGRVAQSIGFDTFCKTRRGLLFVLHQTRSNLDHFLNSVWFSAEIVWFKCRLFNQKRLHSRTSFIGCAWRFIAHRTALLVLRTLRMQHLTFILTLLFYNIVPAIFRVFPWFHLPLVFKVFWGHCSQQYVLRNKLTVDRLPKCFKASFPCFPPCLSLLCFCCFCYKNVQFNWNWIVVAACCHIIWIMYCNFWYLRLHDMIGKCVVDNEFLGATKPRLGTRATRFRVQ